MMKKSLRIFLALLLFFSCRDNSIQDGIVDDISLQRLLVENKSVLEKMDDKLVCDVGKIKKYTVLLTVIPKNRNAVNITVEVNGNTIGGVIPNFRCGLADGDNEIKVISTSKKDASNKKIYTIKLNKQKSNASDEESSKLRELKVDGSDIISSLGTSNVAKLPDVAETKDKVQLYVLPYNASAEIEVTNAEASVSKINKNTYDVSLAFGLNDICVIISSDAEGDKLHIIKIYREEDLNLRSFNVDGIEYCENGRIKQNTIRFEAEKTEAKVSVQAKLDDATVVLKHNGNEVVAKNGFYKVVLELGGNGIEVIVKGKGGARSKSHTVTFMRHSPSSGNGKLLILRADGEDLLHRLLKDNIVVLTPCNNDKTSLKVEARAKAGITIKVLVNDAVASGDGIYNVSLKEGLNKIAVQLYSGSSQVDLYSIFITRYPRQEEPNAPTSEEVQVSLVLSDGVNGSPVDGSYVNIFKTKEQGANPLKHVLIRNGKAKVNLNKNEFYDFKVEGRGSDTEQTRYAASDVISYYVGENTNIIPIIQFPLQRITRPAISPVIKEFKYDGIVLQAGEVKSIDRMGNVSIKVLTAAPMEKLDWSSPEPMLGVGFVPTNDIAKNEGVVYASQSGTISKNPDGKYESNWRWSSLGGMKLIKGDEADIVVVLYDVANNRLEYHARFKTADQTSEDESINVSDFNMDFTVYPTSSSIFSIGKDELTNNSSHYSNELYFKVKKGANHVKCKGFDIYRKCEEEDSEFKLVKHFVYNLPKASGDYGSDAYHILKDNDGVLEEEKTYQYKIVAYTEDDKKTKLDASPMLKIKVPKSTSLLLDYPVKTSISPTDAQNMDYVFKLSNPKILETAKEIKLGFLISDRTGVAHYASKFKYVFDDSNGKDEIYFATLQDADKYQGYYYGTKYSIKRNKITSKSVENLIKIDKATGTIKLTKDFTSLSQASLVDSKRISYTKGTAFYWDILDWGVSEYSDFDDLPVKIISKKENGVTIISITNDERNGNNAWNGRAEFTIKFN